MRRTPRHVPGVPALLLAAVVAALLAGAPSPAAATEPTPTPAGDGGYQTDGGYRSDDGYQSGDGYQSDYGYPTPPGNGYGTPSPTPPPSATPSVSPPPPPELPVTGMVANLAVAGVGLVLIGFGILAWLVAGRRARV